MLSRVQLFVALWAVACQAPLSRGSSQPRGLTHTSRVSYLVKCILYHWATGDAPIENSLNTKKEWKEMSSSFRVPFLPINFISLPSWSVHWPWEPLLLEAVNFYFQFVFSTGWANLVLHLSVLGLIFSHPRSMHHDFSNASFTVCLVTVCLVTLGTSTDLTISSVSPILCNPNPTTVSLL